MKYTKYKLPPWCKNAVATMVMNDVTTEDLSEKTGYCVQHINGILHGRIRSQKAVNAISDCLGISNQYD